MGATCRSGKDEIATVGDRLLEIWAAWQKTGLFPGAKGLPKTPAFMQERVDNDRANISAAEHPIAERVEAAMVKFKAMNARAYGVILDYYLYDRNCKQISANLNASERTVKYLLKLGRYFIAHVEVEKH